MQMVSSTNTKRISVIMVNISLILIFCMPIFSYAAASGLTWECNAGPGQCTFADLIAAVQNLVRQVSLLALGFSVIVIAYAGFLYMSSGGNPGERSKANKVLLSAVKGIILILIAWLIVTLITKGLGVTVDTFLG